MIPKRLTEAAVAMAGLLCLGVGGCSHSMPKKTMSQDQPLAQAPAPVQSASPEEPTIRGQTPSNITALQTVHFDFDSYGIDRDAEAVLRKNADWLKDHPGIGIQVAGNCDQRGTDEYNLALGQRRAKAVRDYYEMLGIPGERIATISFGKEEPVCEQDTEDCYSQNRSAQTLGLIPSLVSRAFDSRAVFALAPTRANSCGASRTMVESSRFCTTRVMRALSCTAGLAAAGSPTASTRQSRCHGRNGSF